MHISRWLVTALCVVGLPVAAAAQTTATVTDDPFPIESHWLVSGLVGSDFGVNAGDPGVNFGGTIGYLWNGVFGGEFQANFSPEFQLDETRQPLLLGEDPAINSYMFNAIGAAPLGANGQWQPYVSGGLGWLTLNSRFFNDEPGDLGEELEPTDSRFAGNLGAGLMGFLGNMGIRGDIRYFRGFEDDSLEDENTPGEILGSAILSRMAFWRGTAGVAFRW